MTRSATCSVVICCYNYERFVRDAIESALAQEHVVLDVVVVDDGSTDGSAAAIEDYADVVTIIRKDNGGQGSAFNAGFAATRGDVVLFLDADDLLDPSAGATAADALAGGAVKVHWPLRVVDEHGRQTGAVFPDVPLPWGDLRAVVAAEGPGTLHFAPTSGNAFTRSFLLSVLPLREDGYRHSPDKYLCWMAVATGEIVTIDRPLGCYRRHGTNYSGHGSTDDLVPRYAARSEDAFPDVARRLGLAEDAIVRWRANDWWCRLERARRVIADTVPAGRPFALLDNFTWAARGTVGGRVVRQFAMNGPPADPEVLVAEAAGLPAEGVEFLVIADPARWWLDHYPTFAAWLDASAPVLVDEPGFQIRRLGG